MPDDIMVFSTELPLTAIRTTVNLAEITYSAYIQIENVELECHVVNATMRPRQTFAFAHTRTGRISRVTDFEGALTVKGLFRCRERPSR
jgi:hypothetical protein